MLIKLSRDKDQDITNDLPGEFEGNRAPEIQRVDRPGTGTIFLLNEEGITVVRSLAAEEEHQT